MCTVDTSSYSRGDEIFSIDYRSKLFWIKGSKQKKKNRTSVPWVTTNEWGGGNNPYNGLYGEALPERGTLFKLWRFKRVRISQVEVYKRVRKSVIWVFKRAFK